MPNSPEPIYGKLPSDWALVEVRDLVSSGKADLQTGPFGTMLHASAYTSTGTPVVAVRNIGNNRLVHDELPRVDDTDLERLERYKLKAGDILFGRKGQVERRALVRPQEEGWLQGSDCIRLRALSNEIDSVFLSYVFGTRAYRDWIARHAQGATMPSLNQEIVGRIPLPLPTVAEQRGISQVLSTLDDKIELNRRMNETLEAVARTIFKSWFVDFEPVRARIEGHIPLVPLNLLDLFAHSLEDSELGMIPRGWRVGSVGEACRRIAMGPFGSDIKTDNFVEIGVPVIRGVNLKRGFVDEGFVFVSENKADELRNANAFSGDIVITHRGTLGQVGLIPNRSRFPRYVVSQSQMLLSVEHSVATTHFIFEYLRSPVGQHSLLANTSQTGVPAIARPVTSIKAMRLVLPPLPVLQAFEELVRPMAERSVANQAEILSLASLRDTLLPKLLSGQIRLASTHSTEVPT